MLARIFGLLLVLSLGQIAAAQPATMRPSPPLPAYPNDASLHSVFFLDPDLGWACGDRGTVLVTVDGGGKWDVVSTGQDGTLRKIHFFDPDHGIALGGRSASLPNQSEALILESIDGGRSWKRVQSSLPAIAAAGLLDGDTMWAVGDCSPDYPSGLFRSSDRGTTWTAASGATPGPWLCGAFFTLQEGILGGYESIAARTTAAGFAPLDLALAKPVAIRAAAALEHGQTLIAGERGSVFRIRRGKSPQFLNPSLPTSLLIDITTIAARGQKIWLAGSPGATVLHSSDAGETWTSAQTGQPAPIRSLYFLDEERGFAVGDLGLILTTRDGGQTWRPQRRPAQHAAYLGVFAQTRHVPWELIARLSGQEGHHGYVTCVAAQPPKPGALFTNESDSLHRAVCRLGGIGGAVLPDYLLSGRGESEPLATLEQRWKSATYGARERLEADLVRQIQMWRPEVIFTDLPPSNDEDSARQLTCQAVLSAVAVAARTSAESDPLLSPWQVKRVYAVQPGRRGFKTVESGQLATRLGRSLQEAAWSARRETDALTTLAPEIFGLQLLIDHTDNDATRSDLFSGIRIEAGGPRRRGLSEPTGASMENITRRAMRHHDVVKLLREASELLQPSEIKSDRLLKALDGLDADFSASALFEMGKIAADKGNRVEAISVWQQLGQGLPDHSLAVEASNRVFAHTNSAEFLWKDKETPTPRFLPDDESDKPPRDTLSQAAPNDKHTETVVPASATSKDVASQEILAILTSHTRASHEARFMAAALQRNSTDPTLAFDFYRTFAKEHPECDLAACAESEIWLLARRGNPPKSAHLWRGAQKRPFLDGKLHEPIWNEDAISLTTESGQHFGSEVWLARDKDFLYLAARCPTNARSKQTKSEQLRDGVNERDDRVELLLDVDRDWSTFFRLAVSENGSTLDDCGGDRTWNPKWYAAVLQQEGQWCVECAIPLSALSPFGPEKGDAWAVGIQRRGPERVIEAWTHPAAVNGHAPGFGLLLAE